MAYTPLASVATFNAGPESDLFRFISGAEQTGLLARASRAVEAYCGRRLSAFTGLVETVRAQDIDVEEAVDITMPLDQAGMLGFSRAQSLGATQLVRACWLREYPPRWTDLWSGSVTAISILRAFAGSQSVDPSTIQYEVDTGHIRFQLGTYIPQGSTLVVTYSGGYATVPDDLQQACLIKAMQLALAELDPQVGKFTQDRDLQGEFEQLVGPYVKTQV